MAATSRYTRRRQRRVNNDDTNVTTPTPTNADIYYYSNDDYGTTTTTPSHPSADHIIDIYPDDHDNSNSCITKACYTTARS